MDKLTIKLIKNFDEQIEYSVLEQSEILRYKGLNYSIYLLDSNKIITFISQLSPQLYAPTCTFFIRGQDKDLDSKIDILSLDFSLRHLLSVLTKENLKVIKQYFKDRNIDFNLVTNLFKTDKYIDSTF